MTDAERIAQFLGSSATPESVEAMLVGSREPAWAHKFSDGEAGVARALAKMLADVRLDEREACEKEVQYEIDCAEHRKSRLTGAYYDRAHAQVQALGWALKHIGARTVNPR